MWWSGRVVFLGLLLTLIPLSALTQVPNLMTYQGRVRSNGTNYTGEGQFKFALVDAGTNTSVQATAIAHVSGGAITSIGLLNPGSGYTSEPVITISDSTGSGAILKAEISDGIILSIEVSAAGHSYTSPTLLIAPPPANLAVTSFWSNDDTSMTGDEPVEHVIAPVEDGLFTVELGRDMSPLRPSIFTNAALHLRVWFNDGASGFQQLAPDQQLTTTPYAMMSALVEDGSVTGAKLAPGAVEPTHLSSNALATVSIPDHLELGDAATHGSLDVFHNDQGGPSLSLDGETTRISGYGDGGRTMFDLTGFNYGHLTLFNQTNPNPTVVLTGVNEAGAVQDEGVGALYINATEGGRRARLTGLQAGGRLELYGAGQTPSLMAYLGATSTSPNDPWGFLQLRNGAGQPRLEASGEFGSLRILQPDGQASLELSHHNLGGYLNTADADGDPTTSLRTGLNNNGGEAFFYQADGDPGVHISGSVPLQLGSEVAIPTPVQIIGAEDGGLLRLRNAAGQTRLEASGQFGALRILQPDGQASLELSQHTFGGYLNTSDANGDPTTSLRTGLNNNGGESFFYQADGDPGVHISGSVPLLPTGTEVPSSTPVQLIGAEDGGLLRLRNGAGQTRLDASGQFGALRILQPDGQASLELSQHNLGGYLNTADADGDPTTSLRTGLNNNGGEAFFYQADGDPGVHISGSVPLLPTGTEVPSSTPVQLIGAEDGGLLRLRNGAGQTRLDASGQSGLLRLRKGDGTTAIALDSEDAEGNGRVITQVLEITGGSDLSEQFDIVPSTDGVLSGMVVCIDPDHPGRLKPCAQAYDRTVAGVVSGAGGVRPGMLMGQAGSLANGSHPVALTGRVFCWVDASYGAVRPGDMITTSETPGHGMIVQRNAEAHGAVLGKAMTALKEGKGLVLLLVSLQ